MPLIIIATGAPVAEGLAGDHIYTMFEELPVQNFAVGDAIMTFDTMHTAKSMENLADAAP
eukprot:gene9091-9261_t